jgi:hypothetical protein
MVQSGAMQARQLRQGQWPNFQWRRVTREAAAIEPAGGEMVGGSIADTNADLKIRNLMDDPRLRALLTTTPSLDAGAADYVVVPLPVRAPGTSLSESLRQGIAGRPAA